jgi:hypothetical protein
MDLAAMYGTPGGPSAEDLEKTAQADLFVKLAADQGIDLNQLSDAQISHLWNSTFSKTAQEGEEEKKEEGEEKEEEKEEEGEESEEEKKEGAARAEFAQMKEWQEKVAEMDYLGRLMAHAYVQELGQIGDSMEKDAISRYTSPGVVKRTATKVLERMRGATKDIPAKLRSKYETVAERVGRQEVGGSRRSGGVSMNTPEEALARGKKIIKRTAAGGAATLAAGGGTAAAMHKKSSALDELAIESALQKVAAANFDVDEAATRIDGLLALHGAPEFVKSASAADVKEAVELRSLELLEAAGYPVNWE